MISDKFPIVNGGWEKTLDKIENMASCYNFGTKDVLQIRLLAEEIITIISPTLSLAAAYCYVSTTEDGFSFTVECAAGGQAMDEKTKKVLLEIGKNTQKDGIFGAIGRVFKYLSDAPYSSHMVPNYGLVYHNTGVGMGSMSMYGWTPEFESELAALDMPKLEKKEKEEENEHAMGISIVEGYADDIQVYLRKGAKKETRLEVTVVKNFKKDQLDGIEIRREKTQ